ncbi:MAG TPA: L-aspartate oxidase [Gemmatimonadales bacterium]|jgi:L-aspartate oxidase|nr:L-aspartate oxidase [Gemmatimonadales bacterium]
MSARPIIVGTGIAGLWTAWRLAVEGRPSVLLTKGGIWDSASAWAQGGIAVALGPGDSPLQHAADTLAAGDGLSDPEAVWILTKEGPDRIRELLAMGATFDRSADGKLRFGLEAAHTKPRVIHAGGDQTGAALIGWLTAIVRSHPLVKIHEHAEVRALLKGPDRVTGLVAQVSGRRVYLRAPAVVLATGGVGQLYQVTTNPLVATGDGWALAHQVGAELRDIEFLQFHPTALKLPGVNPAPLVTEAIRGAGGILVDKDGRRFAFDADPRGELAPRDVVARAVATADATGGAWLDVREIEDFPNRFPGVTRILAEHGLDPGKDLLPVAPALHYAMGGIRTDLEGRTTVEGLWAVGEVACTGVHGANRLASNSLLEGLVFADRVARALSLEPAFEIDQVAGGVGISLPVEEPDGDAQCEAIRQEMRLTMTNNVGLQRTERSLVLAERTLARLARHTPAAAWRTANQLMVASLITRAARHRRESRGGHRRLDYPPLARTGDSG